jgi:hypothetical protein
VIGVTDIATEELLSFLLFDGFPDIRLLHRLQHQTQNGATPEVLILPFIGILNGE